MAKTMRALKEKLEKEPRVVPQGNGMEMATLGSHVEKVLRKVIASLRALNELSDLRVHGAVWTNWAVGKTHTAKKLAREFKREIFYIKVPDTDMSENKLLRMLGMALGCGVRHRLEEMIDLLEGHCRGARLTGAYIIFDEAQRLWTKPRLLSWLKDLSENDYLQFVYLFLGDHHLPEKMARASHSLLERVKVRVQIEPVDELTVEHILRETGTEKLIDILAMADYLRQTRRTTLDLIIIAKACAKKGVVCKTTEDIEKFVRQLGL